MIPTVPRGAMAMLIVVGAHVVGAHVVALPGFAPDRALVAPDSQRSLGPAAADAIDRGVRSTPPDSAVRREIAAMMTGSAAAWNRGDLDAFVRDYAPGDGTTYIGRRGIVRGPAAIRASYAPRFAPGVARGTLRFEDLEVDQLGPGVVNAIAYYVLSVRTAAGADSVIARGPTSLVMRKLGGAWKIVHDHSS